MTEDELVEQLARRLRAIRMAESDKLRDEWKDNPEKMPGRAMLSLWGQTDARQADEVVRLMKWTLTCAAEVTRQVGPEDETVSPATWELWAHAIETSPLTLPPDDWTP